MARFIALLLCLLTWPVLAHAQARTEPPPDFAQAMTGTQFVALDGPNPHEQRNVYIWRPPNAPPGPLPVLYMADGAFGVYVAMAALRGPIAEGRIAPLVVVGIAANREQRYWEYVFNRSHAARFTAHEDWFLHVVIPYAEEVAGASSDPAQRAVGGFSNGGAFALEMAERHPEMFGAVLAHSPANIVAVRLDQRAAHIRWLLSAGRQESREAVAAVDGLIQDIRANPSPVRRCVGLWGHVGPAWRNISPGSVVWLLQLGDPASAETTIERETCRFIGP